MLSGGAFRAPAVRRRAGSSMQPQAPLSWHPLQVFHERFRANLEALSSRDAELAERLAGLKPSQPLSIAAQKDDVFLGRAGSAGIEVMPNPVTPARAAEIATALFPRGAIHWPIVVG